MQSPRASQLWPFIRNGAQLQCIQCALCIDACDDIMQRIERPQGLIAYDTFRNLDAASHHERAPLRLVRPRTLHVRIDMTDHAGAAVPDLVISGEMGRPATDRFDSAGDRPGGIERGLCIGFRVAEDLWGNPSPRMILRP